jgi:asparagine synthase (glutamine-hydrolysing)
MCGINLVLDTGGRLGQEPVDRMNLATVHRGRDHTAQLTVTTASSEVHLGHNRLSVIDTSEAAHQPFRSPDGRYLIIYNGELYNFGELRDELAADGVRFTSHGDTEVVMWMLARHGIDALDRFSGMFAFVFVETQDDVVLIARDR